MGSRIATAVTVLVCAAAFIAVAAYVSPQVEERVWRRSPEYRHAASRISLGAETAALQAELGIAPVSAAFAAFAVRKHARALARVSWTRKHRAFVVSLRYVPPASTTMLVAVVLVGLSRRRERG